MRILIAGDWEFSDYALLKRKLGALTINLDVVEPVLEGSHPVGLLAARWAERMRYKYLVSHEKTLKGRHEEMVKLAGAAVVFTNEEDKETTALLALCEEKKLKVRRVSY